MKARLRRRNTSRSRTARWPIDVGEGAPIVFQHGNPTSSYLWRKVMPACAGLGRLIACDLIGMGDSEKLPDSGPERYSYAEHREFLFALWKELGLKQDVVLVIHDWGSTLGFDWASQHSDRVQGIAYMEAAPLPLTVSPGNTQGTQIASSLPAPVRILMQRVMMPFIAPALGLAHSLQTGGARIVTGLTDPALRSGTFYASTEKKLTGPLVDQSTIFPDLADAAIQRNANEAIYRFL